MIRVTRYDMNDQFLDYVVTFPKLECSLQDNPNLPQNQNRHSDVTYWSELDQDQKMSLNEQRSLQRTKTKVRRYCINRNMKYMWTLTFAKKYNGVISSKGEKTLDAGDLPDAWQLWTNFIQRCKRAGMKFDYIVTIEVQEDRLKNHGEKVYHFHFATNANLPIDMAKAKKRGMKSCMLQLWGHGRIDISKKKSKKKFANTYLMKYISKMFGVTKGKQRYRCSEGMATPKTVYWLGSESDLDFEVQKTVMQRNLDKPFKAYFPLNNGHNEVLFIGLSPGY